MGRRERRQPQHTHPAGDKQGASDADREPQDMRTSATEERASVTTSGGRGRNCGNHTRTFARKNTAITDKRSVLGGHRSQTTARSQQRVNDQGRDENHTHKHDVSSAHLCHVCHHGSVVFTSRGSVSLTVVTATGSLG